MTLQSIDEAFPYFTTYCEDDDQLIFWGIGDTPAQSFDEAKRELAENESNDLLPHLKTIRCDKKLHDYVEEHGGESVPAIIDIEQFEEPVMVFSGFYSIQEIHEEMQDLQNQVLKILHMFQNIRKE